MDADPLRGSAGLSHVPGHGGTFGQEQTPALEELDVAPTPLGLARITGRVGAVERGQQG